jgi:hypothetical protein
MAKQECLTRTVIAPLMMAGASPEEMKRSAAVTARKPGRTVQTSVRGLFLITGDGQVRVCCKHKLMR